MSLIASTAGAQAPAVSFRRAVGTAEVMTLNDGTLSIPSSFMLPETPPAEVAALTSAQGLPLPGVSVPLNVAMVRTGSELVLIDAGAGANFQPTAGKLSETLEVAAIDPAKVTRVIFTHGHADHLWGVIDDFDELRFPNASYVVSAAEWDFWTDPNTAANAPDWLKGMALGSARVLKRLDGKIERRKAGESLAPGLSYLATPGHTPGHMSVLLESGADRILIGGDALTHPAISFARPDWRLGTDHDRDQAVATRRRLLDQLATDRIPLIGFHLPAPGFGMVERQGSAYRFAPLS